MPRCFLASIALVAHVALAARAGGAQAQPLTTADSALVGRILLAEDARDPVSSAFGEGLGHADARVQWLARRALARVRDPAFAARDSFPPLPAPPAYADPSWRLRYRALAGMGSDCALLRTAMRDSSWHVRLRAMDLADASCAFDEPLLRQLTSWARRVPAPSAAAHGTGDVPWQASSHALVALARVAPDTARPLLRGQARSRVAGARLYAARAARVLHDTATLRLLAADADDNVREAAIEGLVVVAGHAADDAYLAALTMRGYQAVRAAARALAGSPRGADVARASLDAARRLRRDSSETSRDARMALIERIGDVATARDASAVADLARDFDCAVAKAATGIARRLGALLPTRDAPFCVPLPSALPPDAVALALGAVRQLVVTMAPASGGGSFTVQLRGDLAPLMGAHILDLVRQGYYNGLTWHRVEPDFVIQGGSPGANEYVGHPRYLRDELGAVPHLRGTVGMSTRGHDTGDGQWFVNLRDNPRLTRDYTIFGQVISGIDVVDGVLEGDAIARIVVRPGAPARAP